MIRVKIILFVLSFVWISLLVRVFYLSIQSNNYYETLSHRNTIKTELLSPIRGEIHDRNNIPIAINELGFRIQVLPHLSGKKNIEKLEEEISFIASLIKDINQTKLIKKYKKYDSYYNHDNIDVIDFISYQDIVPIYSKLNLRENIKIVPSPKRKYPYKEIAAHVLGYVAKANKKDVEKDPLLKLIGSVGKSGVERYYNRYLEGEAGEKQVQVSASNEQIEVLSSKSPIENRNLTLSIDIELEKYISELFKGKTGSVVVMDINGSILSASSFPEYDLNAFVFGISSKDWRELISSVDSPFTNKLVNGLYPPGSTIKTGLGLLYITSGISEWWYATCSGSMTLGNRNFRCWKHDGHEKTTIRKAIRESCDDYFYKGSLKVGIATMSQGLMRYGLGQKTGIDLPNEFIGTVPSRAWKRHKFNQPWYIGETLNTSIGQGDFLTTPVQIAQFTALMATGKLVKPTIAYEMNGERKKPEFSEVLNASEKKRLPIIQRAMIDVCNHPKGTATHYLHSKVKIAGKTGTAQVVGISQEVVKRLKEHEMEKYRRSHAWFTTYGPYKHPQYIVTVLVEHGGHGGAAAGSIVSKIYNRLYEDGYITSRY